MFEVLFSYVSNMMAFVKQIIAMIQSLVKNQREENDGKTTQAK